MSDSILGNGDGMVGGQTSHDADVEAGSDSTDLSGADELGGGTDSDTANSQAADVDAAYDDPSERPATDSGL